MGSAVSVAAYILLGRSPAAAAVTLAVHYMGLLALFLFLTAGEVCHVLAWRAYRRQRLATIARVLDVWRTATELAPAAAAILVLSSGLRLSTLLQASPREGWLFCLASGFAALATDGATGYTESVQRAWSAARKAQVPVDAAALRSTLGKPSFHLLFLIHYLAFFVLFYVGYRKPSLYSPFHETLARLESFYRTIAGLWAPALTTLTLVVIVSLAGLFSRTIASRRTERR